jgi:hypothetical protein
MFLEPWDLKLASSVLNCKNPEKEHILSDEQAYDVYENHRHWYDKLFLAKRWSNIPTVFGEVVKKPRCNLEGMSKNCTYFDLEENIIQQKVEGRHLTIDWCINPKIPPKSNIPWQRYSVFEGHKDFNNSFYLFESLPYLDSWEVYSKIDLIIKELVKEGYQGRFVNFEFIGPYLIEMHLRPSVQFMDIDGGLIKFGLCGGELPTPHDSYSYVYRQNQDATLIKHKTPIFFPDSISSYQVCCEAKHKLSEYTQDYISYRKYVINGVNKKDVIEFKNVLDLFSVWE